MRLFSFKFLLELLKFWRNSDTLPKIVPIETLKPMMIYRRGPDNLLVVEDRNSESGQLATFLGTEKSQNGPFLFAV